MNRVTKYYRLIGLVAILGLSNTAYAVCTFNPVVPDGFSAPDEVSDLSGQGNFSCANVIGADGVTSMTNVTGVEFQNNGDWEMVSGQITVNGFVTNTPDRIVLIPQGQTPPLRVWVSSSCCPSGPVLQDVDRPRGGVVWRR